MIYLILTVLFQLATIAYMGVCIAKCKNPAYKIVAGIFLISSLLNLALHSEIIPYELRENLGSLMRIRLIGSITFVILLFMTASQVQAKGENGAVYNYIIGSALGLMILFSVPQIMQYIDGSWFYEYRIRMWPELAILGTFVAMKLNKVSLKKDEDFLLWYFAVSALYVMLYYVL